MCRVDSTFGRSAISSMAKTVATPWPSPSSVAIEVLVFELMVRTPAPNAVMSAAAGAATGRGIGGKGTEARDRRKECAHSVSGDAG